MEDRNSDGPTNRRGGRKRAMNEDHLPEEEKAKKQKNRDAAKKCREKKHKETIRLKEENIELDNQNKDLARKKTDLENKLANYLQIMQMHLSHGCQLPDDVKRILENENNISSNQSTNFPMEMSDLGNNQGTFMRLSEDDSRYVHSRMNGIQQPHLDSKVPTGLFSGTQVHIGKTKSNCKDDQLMNGLTQVPVIQPLNHEMTSRPSQAHAMSSSVIDVAIPALFEIQNGSGGVVRENQDQSQSSSPVQQVPNIDQIPWSSPSLKAIGTNESDDEESTLLSAQNMNILPQTSNVFSAVENQPGVSYNNLNTVQIASNDQNIVHFSKVSFKPTDSENVDLSRTGAHSPIPLWRATQKNKNSSLTQSLQVTTAFLSQALQDISPSQMSQPFHDQIIECAKPGHTDVSNSVGEKSCLLLPSSSTLVNEGENVQPVSNDQPNFLHMEYKDESQPCLSPQVNQLSSEVQTTIMPSTTSNCYSLFRGMSSINSVPMTVSQYDGCPQSFVTITNTQGDNPQLVTYPITIIPSQGQTEQEIVHNSQIPTTVLNSDDDEEEHTEAVQKVNENFSAVASVMNDNNNNMSNGNVLNSSDNYSEALSEMPSLSFNDLKNEPKEIFNKKPRRANQVLK